MGAARRHGIEAQCTLHWFVHPRWFDLIGGFTKAENIDVYIDWVQTAFGLFGAPCSCSRSRRVHALNEALTHACMLPACCAALRGPG